LPPATHTAPQVCATRAIPVTRTPDARRISSCFARLGSTRGTLRSTDDLVRAGLVPADQAEAVRALEADYAVAVPPAFRALIEDPGDAIGLQVVPRADEAIVAPHEMGDPTADAAMSPLPGLVHRYPVGSAFGGSM
jgi:L-lysine 2,3-aminomutase